MVLVALLPAPALSSRGEKIVLNVGCGYPLRQKLHRHFHGPEWREVRLDLDPAVQPDIVCSITNINPVAANTVDAIWYAAGDSATDFNFYTKRGLLAAVYGATMLYWLDDRSPDCTDTDCCDESVCSTRLAGPLS